MKATIVPRRLQALRPDHWRRGNIVVLAAAMMVMIFGFTSFTVDVGYITLTKTQLQSANDSAVLAAVQELPLGLGYQPDLTPAEVAAVARTAAVDVAGVHKAGDRPSIYVESNRDVRLGQVHWDAGANNWVKQWGVAPYNMVEVTLRRDQSPGSPDGSLPLFFGPVIGHHHANLTTTATAAILPGSGFRLKPGSSQRLDILPIALDEPTWEALVQRNESEVGDLYSYDPDTGAIRPGPDGIKELCLYPYSNKALPPGNRGTVDIGHANNSTADLSRQILYGINQSDLDALGFELNFDNGPLILNGDTGISAGIKDELAAIKGQPRAIPIFTHVSGNGNNAMYTIVKFVGIRIMHVKLTGNPKRVIVQPAPYVSSTVVRDETTKIYDSYLFTAPVLIQ